MARCTMLVCANLGHLGAYGMRPRCGAKPSNCADNTLYIVVVSYTAKSETRKLLAARLACMLHLLLTVGYKDAA